MTPSSCRRDRLPDGKAQKLSSRDYRGAASRIARRPHPSETDNAMERWNDGIKTYSIPTLRIWSRSPSRFVPPTSKTIFMPIFGSSWNPSYVGWEPRQSFAVTSAKSPTPLRKVFRAIVCPLRVCSVARFRRGRCPFGDLTAAVLQLCCQQTQTMPACAKREHSIWCKRA